MTTPESLRSARLLRCAQGIAAGKMLPDIDTKSLVAQAKAVGMFLESGDYELARAALASIGTILDEHEDASAVTGAMRRHVQNLEKVLP